MLHDTLNYATAEKQWVSLSLVCRLTYMDHTGLKSMKKEGLYLPGSTSPQKSDGDHLLAFSHRL
jgi:hypothetical protein